MFHYVSSLTQLFTDQAEFLSLPAGGVLFHQGDLGHCMYLVKYGNVDIQVNGKLVDVGDAGSPLGEESLLENAPRMGTVVATTDCKLIVVDRAQLNTMNKSMPVMLHYMKKLLALRRTWWDCEIGHDFA